MFNILRGIAAAVAVWRVANMMTKPERELPMVWRIFRWVFFTSLAVSVVSCAAALFSYCVSIMVAHWPF